MNPIKLQWIALCSIWVLFITGCQALQAREEAYAGKEALANCQFEIASFHFKNAHDILNDHRDIMLGLAISETLSIFNTQEMTDVLHQLGVTTSLSVFCQQIIQNQPQEDDDIEYETDSDPQDPSSECASEESHLKLDWPHPCATQNKCQFENYISPSLQWMDIARVIEKNREKLIFVSDLFFNLGIQTEESYAFEGFTVHAADLLFVSSVLRLTVLVNDIISQYHLDFSISQTFVAKDCESHAAYLNQNIGISDGIPNKTPDIALLTHAMMSLNLAFQQAQIIRKTVDDAKDSCFPKPSMLQWHQVGNVSNCV